MLAWPAGAEKTSEVSLRYSRQESTLRVVLESDDDTIKNATATPALAALKIEFPGRFELKQQKDFPFEVSKKDRMITIPLKDVSEVKTYRLSAPARIVFDIRASVRTQKETPRTDQKPDQKAATQAAAPAQPAPAPPAGQKPPQTPPVKPAEQQQPEKGKRVKNIMIDVGHGGYESGITSSQAKEKDVNLTVAKELSALLARKGYTVSMTRKVDQPSSLTERINFANGKNPDVFISIHASSSEQAALYIATQDDQTADAVRLFGTSFRQARHLTKSRNLAKVLADTLKADLGMEVAQRELPLPVLGSMNATAVMVEYPSVTAYAADAKLRDRFVNAIARGIAAHEQ